jgi:hypothetical protein
MLCPVVWYIFTDVSKNYSVIFRVRKSNKVKGKGLPQQAEVVQGVPVRLRPRIFLTFGTTWVVGRQPYSPAAFTPKRNLWYSFVEAEPTPGHMVPSVTTEKSPVTPPGIDPPGRPTSSEVP